jgi:TolB protein
VTLVGLVGVALFALLGRSAQSQTESPALSARSSVSAGALSSKIAFIREPPWGYAGVLWIMNPDGSGQRKLAPAHPGMRWSPDGQKIVFVGSGRIADSHIYVMNADGSGLQRLTSPAPGRCDGQGQWNSSPAWSPDGRAIAFTRSYCGRRYSEEPAHVHRIYVMNADGSEQRMLARNPTDFHTTELAWSPRGDKIAFVSRRDGNLEIYVMNPDGSEQQRLTRNTVRDSNPVWSPDGRRIAFESNWQLWVMNADGSAQRRLTRNGARNLAPAWSPGGRRIAFERRIGRVQSTDWCSGCGTARAFEVHVMNADGSGQRRLTPRGPDLRAGLDDQDRRPGWSPDGRRIAFISKRDGQTEVYVMNADGSGQRNLSRTRGWQERWFAWSPAQK